MRTVALVFSAIIVLAVAACGDDFIDAPAPAPTDTPLSAPPAPVSAALKVPASAPTVTPVMAVAVEVAPAHSPPPTSTQPSTPTQALTPAPASTHTPRPAPVPTDTPTSSLTPAPTLVPLATDTAVPTATHTATATNTSVPTATETPIPTATSLPTSTPTPAPTATNTPVPTPSVDPALASYSPLLIEAVSSYQSGLDFVGDGLSPEEKNILDWADGRLFTNPSFLASVYGPDNWPADVKLASVQAIPLLMLAIDIQKRDDGKHVVNWEVDSLDRILDELGVYEGVCTSCYGSDYDTVDKVADNYDPVVRDSRHVHREMLKTLAYFAKSDGEGILIRSLMQNNADDFELLYKRDLETLQRLGSFSLTEFGWRNLSFMSQVKLPDGSVESFPTMVYEIVGSVGNERQAVERLFDYLNRVMTHFGGDYENFSNLYRPYSQTPYTPEAGYLLIVREAGSPSSTGLVTSASRLLGIRAEHFLSPNYGYRVGSIRIDGNLLYYEGNSLGLATYTKNMPACALIRTTMDQVENFEFDTNCAPHVMPYVDTGDGLVSPDRAVLVALYNSTDGANWKNKDNWLSDRPIDEWFGVATINNRVTQLFLRDNGLMGNIPSALGRLAHLGRLELDGNSLDGVIPAELGGLTYLRHLRLSGNNLIGQIPSGLADLPFLVSMNLSNNRLSGEIPDELGGMTYLTWVSLERNHLTGQIPSRLGDLGNLRVLTLGDNQLNGAIPSELGKPARLRWIELSRNELSGTVPPELGNLRYLSHLDLGFNQLTGQVPAGLGNLSELSRLDLRGNQMTGCVPAALDKSQLVYLGTLPFCGS